MGGRFTDLGRGANEEAGEEEAVGGVEERRAEGDEEDMARVRGLLMGGEKAERCRGGGGEEETAEREGGRDGGGQ